MNAERRAKHARRSSRLIYPKTAARKLHPSRLLHKNQNPQNGQHRARFDWGLGAICFGASPVAGEQEALCNAKLGTPTLSWLHNNLYILPKCNQETHKPLDGIPAELP
jgi:hypothetical protein